ncbi:MAG: glycerol-3-phosphate 1-O-acyltransferase PlsY [Coriobacteriia bacterium]|nr:glycerol-3-phosphate 1-O-acyltransferase PlsY [Coriobacteriia bacterium]
MLAQLHIPLWLGFILLIIVCYFLGAIPFSLIVGKVFYRKDLRKLGSGNLGTTNAYRCLGPVAGTIVLILDCLKGAVAIYLARLFVPMNASAAYYGTLSPLVRVAYRIGGYPALAAYWALIACAVAAIVGHAFSPYINFTGGKAVAATGGILLAMVPKVVLILLPLFLIMLLATRYVSVASMTIAVALPFSMWLFYPSLPFIIFSVVAALFVIWLHRGNIVRLRAGTENKLGASRGQAQEDH